MKKESMYVKKNNKIIDHNQKYSDIKDNNINKSINDKIEELFNTNGYVFNKDVEIITNNKKYCTRVAGKVNNYLITMDNDIINILDIKDIVI